MSLSELRAGMKATGETAERQADILARFGAIILGLQRTGALIPQGQGPNDQPSGQQVADQLPGQQIVADVQALLLGIRASASRTVRSVKEAEDAADDLQRPDFGRASEFDLEDFVSDPRLLETLLGLRTAGAGEMVDEFASAIARSMFGNENAFARGETMKAIMRLPEIIRMIGGSAGRAFDPAAIERLVIDAVKNGVAKSNGSGGLVPRTGTTSRGEKCTCSPSTSSSILQASGARR